MGEQRRSSSDGGADDARQAVRPSAEMASAKTLAGLAVQQETDPLLGVVLGDRYRIERRLGEGGMGVVYLAEHVVIGKKVALKVLSAELTRNQEVVKRFLQEARSASRIGHENVIDVTDFGHTPGAAVFLVMELLEGQDLGQCLRASGPLPWARAKPILIQVCRALRAAHARGVVHRDIKPENVFLANREGRPDFVKVLDFGIAHLAALDTNSPRLTRAGAIYGTPEYMSPEQAEGQKVDERADVYAVGCVAFRMVTGVPPFSADSVMALLNKHVHEPPPRPTRLRPDLAIPAPVETLILKSLEKDRERRFPDMESLARAIAAVGPPPALSLDPSELLPAAPGLDRRRRMLLVLGAALVAAAAVVVALTGSRSAPPAAPHTVPLSSPAPAATPAPRPPAAPAARAPAAPEPRRELPARSRAPGKPARAPAAPAPPVTPAELKNPFAP